MNLLSYINLLGFNQFVSDLLLFTQRLPPQEKKLILIHYHHNTVGLCIDLQYFYYTGLLWERVILGCRVLRVIRY